MEKTIVKYFKDNAGNVFVDPIVENHDGLIEIDKEEFDKLCNPEKSIEQCRCEKLAELYNECGARIDAGFENDVLGYPCQYHNNRDQQQTMRDSAINGGKIWRNEEFTMHTKSQAEIVLLNSISEKERHRTNYANKCSYVNSAERTADEINDVTWDSVE